MMFRQTIVSLLLLLLESSSAFVVSPSSTAEAQTSLSLSRRDLLAGYVSGGIRDYGRSSCACHIFNDVL